MTDNLVISVYGGTFRQISQLVSMYFSRGWEVVKASSNDNAFILGFQKEKVRQSNLKGGVTNSWWLVNGLLNIV